MRPYLGEGSLKASLRKDMGVEEMLWVQKPWDVNQLSGVVTWARGGSGRRGKEGVVVKAPFMPCLHFILSVEKPLKGFKQRRDSFRFLYETWIEVR